MNNPITALSKVSKNPKGLLATGIAKTVESLGNDNNLRDKILELIDGKVVLTPDELTLIEDALTSQVGGEAMVLVNYRLLCNFMDEKGSRNAEFAALISQGMDEFLSGDPEEKEILLAMSKVMKEFAEAQEREPDNISAPAIGEYIKALQKEAIRLRDNSLFINSCVSGKSHILNAWERNETKRDEHGDEYESPYTLEVRYDPENNLIGGWDSRGRMLGYSVISGYTPMDELPGFSPREYTLPCLDAEGKLSLIEFNPQPASYGGPPAPYLSIIGNENIGERETIKAVDGQREIFYCLVSDGYRDRIISTVIGEKHGRTILLENNTNQININGDVIFVTEDIIGGFWQTHIHSVQTGGTLSLKKRHVAGQTETETDIIWTLRERQNISGTLHSPNGGEADWSLPGFMNKTFGVNKVSLLQLLQAWKKAALKEKSSK